MVLLLSNKYTVSSEIANEYECWNYVRIVSSKMQMYYNNINAAFPSKSIQRHVFEKNLHEKLHAQPEVMCKPKKE